MSILSTAVLLFLILDPVGNIPVFLSVLKDIDRNRHRPIIVREMLIALAILGVLLFVGPALMRVLELSEPSLSIAGGIVLFLIAIKMVFPPDRPMFGETPDGEPFVVPLAIPMVAGPSAIATVVLMARQAPERRWQWLLALVLAWAVSTAILLAASPIEKRLGQRGLFACERLMGLLLTVMAVERLMNGLRQFLGIGGV